MISLVKTSILLFNVSIPCVFRADGDTIFSAASGSGMGKSSLLFDTEVTVADDAASAAPLNNPDSDHRRRPIAACC